MGYTLKAGDIVVFNCPFENAITRIERGEQGTVKAGKGPLGFYSVIAKGQVWLCKQNEIRLQGRVMDAKRIFEESICRKEKQMPNETFRFVGETQAEFDARVDHRIKRISLLIGDAYEIPDIDLICPGANVRWEGFKIERRRTNQLDSLYVSRA